MKSQWMPRLFDRTSWEEWETMHEKGPRNAAAERMRSVLDSHEPDPLDEAIELDVGLLHAEVLLRRHHKRILNS